MINEKVEIVADAATGNARMAVAQPAGSKAAEVLNFYDSSPGRIGPIAWQMHNAGLFDEYKDVMIETNPVSLVNPLSWIKPPDQEDLVRRILRASYKFMKTKLHKAILKSAPLRSIRGEFRLSGGRNATLISYHRNLTGAIF